MADIQLKIFTAETRDQALDALVPGATLERLPGKPPILRAAGGGQIGCSITHVREAKPPLSILAVSTDPIGIDAEVWPQTTADPALLETVASTEDKANLGNLRHLKGDLARFLWVVKEAALKACGEVMTDPQHIKVTVSADQTIAVSTSSAATAPLADMEVQVLQLTAKDAPGRILVAIAGFSKSYTGDSSVKAIQFSEPGWVLEALVLR